jgi:hypothetical protein
MQLVIGALLRALPGIGSVSFVIGIIWLIFRHVNSPERSFFFD